MPGTKSQVNGSSTTRSTMPSLRVALGEHGVAERFGLAQILQAAVAVGVERQSSRKVVVEHVAHVPNVIDVERVQEVCRRFHRDAVEQRRKALCRDQPCRPPVEHPS